MLCRFALVVATNAGLFRQIEGGRMDAGGTGRGTGGFCDLVHGGAGTQPINRTQDQFDPGRAAPYVHADWHAMAASVSSRALPSYCGLTPNSPATPIPAGTACYFAGTEGGLFRSSDVFTALPASNNASGAPHFEGGLGRGLVTHLAYSIATDLHDSTNPIMIGGLQDKNQIIDAFDLVRESVLDTSAADADYDPAGNLTGATHAIDRFDFDALVARMGGRP